MTAFGLTITYSKKNKKLKNKNNNRTWFFLELYKILLNLRSLPVTSMYVYFI